MPVFYHGERAIFTAVISPFCAGFQTLLIKYRPIFIEGVEKKRGLAGVVKEPSEGVKN
jgi:hypothetical protein